MRAPDRQTPTVAWSMAKVLLVVGVLCVALGVWIATRPVTNPGVQDCGPALEFVVGNKANVVIFPGEPGAPPEAVVLAGQPLCRELALLQLQKAALAVLPGFAMLLLGAVVGLLDDRVALWRAPRFESLLRPLADDERSAFGLRPGVPLDELGWELPPIERRDVAGFAVATAVVAVGLPLAAGIDRVLDAAGGIGIGAVVLAALVVVASYVASAGQRMAAFRLGSWPRTLRECVASSWAGAVRPALGTFGIDAHHLGVCEPMLPFEDIDERVGSVQVVSLSLHAVALVLLSVVVVAEDLPPVNYDPRFWVVAVVALALAFNGVATVGGRVRSLPVRPNRSAWRGLGAVAAGGAGRFAGLVASSLAVLVLHVGTWVVLVDAVGGRAPVVAVAFVAVLSLSIGALAGTPSGLVAADAAAFLLLVRFGTPPGAAAAAILAVRVLRTWVPLMPGAVAAARLRAAGEL